MNRIKRLSAILAAAAVFCSCGGKTAGSGTDSSTGIPSPASEIPEGQITKPSEGSKELKAEISSVLSEFGEFSRSYLLCKSVGEAEVDKNDTVEADGKVWQRVTGGEYITYSALEGQTKKYCTDEMISLCSLLSYYRKGEDDSLYVWNEAGSDVGAVGSDAAYINSVELNGEDIAVVKMTAVGDKDYRGYENISFTVTLKYEDGAWKIHSCGLEELGFLMWIFEERDN